MKMFAKLAGVSAAFLLGANAHAAVIDFAAHANGNEHGIADGATEVVDGILLGFGAGAFDGGVWQSYHPYFDSGNAGLGTCRVLKANAQCKDAGDDSVDGDVGLNESIAFFFMEGERDINGLSFRDGEHNLIDDSAELVQMFIYYGGGGVDDITLSFADAVALAIAGIDNVFGLAFRFVATEFYISSASVENVPVPAALPLLLSGLAGLGFATRKKKSA